jgi:tetratricopeptide (TPR) repeat protein
MVAAAAASGDDRLTWQLAETLWHAAPPSAARADWIGMGHTGLDAATREQDPVVQLRLLTLFGMAYRKSARYDEGLECLGRALELTQATGRRFDEAKVLNSMGLIHLRRRELDRAVNHFRDAGAILGDLGDQRLVGAVHANAATAHYRAGRLPEAAVALWHALDVYRSSDDPGGLGNVLRLRAELHLAAGRQDEALADARQAMDIALALRDHTREAYWLLTLGDVQRATASYGDALASYQRSAMLHRRLGDRSREALAWRGTALAYADTGRKEEAVGFLRQAAAAHRTLGDAWEEATDLDHLTRLDPEGADGRRARVLELIAPFDDPRAEALRVGE